MRMEINIALKVIVLVSILTDNFLGRPDCWLVTAFWIQVEPVQVLTQGIETIVTAGDAIWVQSRNDFEYIVLS